MPEPGAVVTARVSQVTPTGAHCRILCVGPRALDVEFKGLIRWGAFGGGGWGERSCRLLRRAAGLWGGVVRRSLRPAGPGLRPKRGAAAPSPRTARLQDVRATEVDRVVMYDCFRPGDVVRAEVVSLGDARSYHLSTARNELGVVHATSMAGNVMVPASWQEMRDPETQRVERRKVARVAGQQAAP